MWIGVITPSDQQSGYTPLIKIMLNSLNNNGDTFSNEHLKISDIRPSMPGLLFDFRERITYLSSVSEIGQSSISSYVSPKFPSNVSLSFSGCVAKMFEKCSKKSTDESLFELLCFRHETFLISFQKCFGFVLAKFCTRLPFSNL